MTETQAEALVKLAGGLITAIDEEVTTGNMAEPSTKFTFKYAFGDLLSVLKGAPSQCVSEPQRPVLEEAHYHPQPIRIM